MVQNNKVLTVSYGTFSCTLEGFEDSFGTMKVIAEYFRDLAADDRYFGAEPPQPDADLLARIAQKEIARQVEARADAEGIHLRADTAAPAALPPVAQPQTPAPAAAAAAPVAEPAAQAEEPAEHQPEAPAADAPVAVTAAEEPEAQEAQAAPEAEDIPAAPVAVDPAEVEAGEALIGNVAEDAAPAGTADAADSIAAKLQRIRDVVARGSAADDDEYSEDEHAEAFLKDAAGDIAESLEEELEIEESAESEEPAGDDEIARALDHLDLTGSVPEDDSAEIAAETRTDAAEDEAAPAGDDGNEAEPAEAAPDRAAQDRPARARIVRVKRAAVEEAIAKGDLEEITDEADEAEDDGATALSDEDEAELMRELAAVEAELRGSAEIEDEDGEDDYEDDWDSGEDLSIEEPEEVEAGPAAGSDNLFAEDSPSAAESDVSRLMAAADQKLEDPETATSRETYSRLRAAVKAAEAERAAGGTSGTGDESEAYREDLASVVRPRRPEASAGRGQGRPVQPERAAPLKLVAEQRIDAGDNAGAEGPVRPRRISSFRAEEQEFEAKGSEGGFAEYAKESGAAELHELLEAAASYMRFVEGREQFSRPQLMNKVQQLGEGQFNREDGLRSFGLLLREGKIERTHSGRFTASGDIGFQPGQRAAG